MKLINLYKNTLKNAIILILLLCFALLRGDIIDLSVSEALAANDTYTITYNANGGTFSNGTEENKVQYNANSGIRRISKTSNVNEDGNSISGGFPVAYNGITDTITIDGATALKVTITYQTSSSYGEHVAVYDGTVIPERYNYDESVSGRLHGTTKTTETFIVMGDTTNIFWRADSATTLKEYFGYYAIIEPVFVISDGVVESPKPSKHETRFVGWYTDSDCTDGNEFDPTKISDLFSDMDVYAKYADVETLYSDTVGGCSWTIYEDGLLKIYPTNNISGQLPSNEYSSKTFWPWHAYATSIISVEVEDGVLCNDNASYLFYKLDCCLEMNINNINTINVTDMSYMFYGCSKLTELDVSGFDTRNVTNMQSMFQGCARLTNLDLSSFDTNNVTDISYMFYSCSNLFSLNLSSFTINSNVEQYYCFTLTYSLKKITFPINFEFSSSYHGFYSSSDSWKKVLDVNGIQTNDDTIYTSREISALSEESSTKLSGTWMLVFPQAVFSKDDGSLTFIVDVAVKEGSEYNGKIATNVYTPSMSSTYQYDNTLPWKFRRSEVLKVIVRDVISPKSTRNWFNYMDACTEMDLNKLDTSNTTNMSYMFYGCKSLTNLNLNSFNTSNVTDMSDMFAYCKSLTSLDVSNFNASKVTDMSYMFYNCSSLTELDVSNFNTSKVTDMNHMFGYCDRLTSLDVSNFDTSNVTNMNNMFGLCYKLASLDVSNFDTSKVTNMSLMFHACRELTSLDLSSFDTALVTDMTLMLGYCSKLTSLDLSSFDTALVTDMGQMFSGCINLNVLNIGNFDTSQVTKMDTMFKDVKNLTKITFGENFTFIGTNHYFNTSQIGNGWIKVRDLDGTKLYDKTEYAANTIAMLNNSTTPILAGTWARYGIEDDYITNPDGTVEFISNDDNWAMESDTVWTYTFPVFDDTLIYYLFEEIMTGYSSAAMMPYYIQINDKMATITNTSTAIEESTSVGGLLITKIVNGIETNERFEINITLTGTEISNKQIFNDVIFENGVAKVSLRNGESMLFDELPVGTTYSVTEKSYLDYTTEITGGTGAIEEDVTKSVEIVNTYVETPVVTPEEKTVNITLEKKIEGNIETEQNFNISVYLTGLKPNTTYAMSNGERFTSNLSGSAFYTAAIHSNESIVIYNIPVGAQYQFIEEAGNYIASYKIGDGEIISNTATNTSMSTELKTAVEGENITITFINKLRTIQSLTISKVVKEEQEDGTYVEYETDEEFEINIKFSNMVEGTSFSSSIGKVTADEYGEAYKTFYLKSGESVDFFNIPVGTEYVVEESANDYSPSYMVTGLGVVKNSDETRPKKTLSTRIESIQSEENGTVTFTNIKEIPKIGKLAITKEVANNTSSNKGFEFNITLTGEDIFGTQEFNGVTFIEGFAKIYIKNGESKEFDLPAGTTYKVEEAVYDGYSTSYVMNIIDLNTSDTSDPVESTSCVEGSIVRDKKDSIVVTNTPKLGKLVVKKEVEGIETDEEFEFTITLTGAEITGTQEFGGIIFVDGVANIQLADGESKEFEIPVGTTYKVEEAHFYNYEDSYDKQVVAAMTDVISNVGDNSMSYVNGSISHNMYDVITVTNTYTAVDITLKKFVTNIETSAKFTINAEFKNLEPLKTYSLSNGATMTADTNGNAAYTAMIGHNEEVVFQDIPVGANYKFTEVAGEYIASYSIVDSNKE